MTSVGYSSYKSRSAIEYAPGKWVAISQIVGVETNPSGVGTDIRLHAASEHDTNWIGSDKSALQIIREMDAAGNVGMGLCTDGAQNEASAAGTDMEAPLVCGDLTLDGHLPVAHHNGRAIKLTPIEYRLLRALVYRQEHLVSRSELASSVWADAGFSFGRAIDVHIRRLRMKVETDKGPRIFNVRSFGYLISATARTAVEVFNRDHRLAA